MKKNTLFKRGDFILLFSLLITGAAIFLIQSGHREHGDMVEISIDGRRYALYPVSGERIIDIGDTFHNRLVIKENKVYMESADCKDQYCVAHKPISRTGETIICLPHRLVVTIISSDGKKGGGIYDNIDVYEE